MESTFSRVISRSTAPPVSRQEARDQLFLFTDNQYDTLLDRLLLVATERAESLTGRYFSAVTAQAYFPSRSDMYVLPDEAVTSIVSLTYTDENGQVQIYDSSNYTLDQTAERPVVLINTDTVFPEVSQRVANPVIIQYAIAEPPRSSGAR